MDRKQMGQFAEEFLGAWNTQDVETVAGIYADDVIYRDPNIRGDLRGGADLRKYLKKLLAAWDMQWFTREGFPLKFEEGAGFLWRAEIKKRGASEMAEVFGMDLVLIRDGKVCRNEVYFDRSVLAKLM